MFQLTEEEFKNLIFHFGISSWGGVRKMPFAFNENGIAMLSGILNSKIAIEVNILIIRVFTRLRQILLTNKDILLQLEKLENQTIQNSEEIKVIFSTLRAMLNKPQAPRQRIGFKRKNEP
jgi:hypothetical protein